MFPNYKKMGFVSPIETMSAKTVIIGYKCLLLLSLTTRSVVD